MGSLTVLFLWRYRFAAWAYAPMIFFLGFRAFLGWGRYAIITALLTLALLQLYRNHQRWFRLRNIIIAIPIVILFQNLGMDRDLIRNMVEGDRVVEAVQYRDDPGLMKNLDAPDFANFEFLSYVLWAVPKQSRTYTYFTQYIQLFTEPIPRIIWKEKPVGAPIQLVNLNDYGNFIGMTVSLPGDGWMSLGWTGLIATMAFVGFILGRMHRWFWRNQGNAKIILLYCMFMPLSIQWFRDGGISIAKFALWAWLPLIIWVGFEKLIIAFRAPGVGGPQARTG